MSDLNPNLTQKISETITNAFKKTKIFEKIGKIEKYVVSFIIVSSIFTLTGIYMNYSNTDKIKKLEEKIEGSENVLRHDIEINRIQNSICNHTNVKYLKDLKTISLDTQEKVIQNIMEIKMLLQNSKKEVISRGTSISSLSQVESIDSINDWKDNMSDCENMNECENKNEHDSINELENIIDLENINDLEDNELLNECYDSIPLNNLKKNTSSWFI
jgi:hypothetical protein